MPVVRRPLLTGSALAALFVVLAACFWVMAFHASIADEAAHADQILRFTRGDFALNSLVTQIPGYHAIIAALAWATGRHSLFALRLFSFGISILCVALFALVARVLDRGGMLLRTAQFVFFPILLPYFFLVYTDITSLLFILLSLLAVIRRRPVLAALASLGAVLIRQDNVVWAGFFWLLLLWQDETLRKAVVIRGRRLQTTIGFRLNRDVWRRFWSTTWLFLLLFIAFGIFAWLNHGIALGDRGAHPFPSFHLGNVYLLLFLFFFLFLPINLSNFPRIIALLRGWKGVAIFLGLLAFAVFFLFTFVNDHPDNQAMYSFFLRNRILVFFTASVALKLLFFLPVAYSVLSLAVTRLWHRSFVLLYPLTVIFLVPSWLIEQRYYLIPFILFVLVRERRSNALEYITTVLYVMVSLGLLAGIAQGAFFL